MDVGFATERLRDLCESRSPSRIQAPAVVVGELHARLADIRAATCASDLIVARAEIDARPPGRVRFRLGEAYELLCAGSVVRPYLTSDGLVDLERVRRIVVTKFGRSDHA